MKMQKVMSVLIGMMFLFAGIVSARVRMVLDLGEVNLVDVEVVRFLSECENEGVVLVHCPAYVREWILRERAEGAQTDSH
jgi:hypothetical protein